MSDLFLLLLLLLLSLWLYPAAVSTLPGGTLYRNPAVQTLGVQTLRYTGNSHSA